MYFRLPSLLAVSSWNVLELLVVDREPLLHDVLGQVTRPIYCWPTGTTSCTQLQWALQVAEFDTESREGRERVDDDSTSIACVVIEFVGIRPLLDCTVDADRMGDEVVLPPRTRFAYFRAGQRIAECTAGECLLHVYRGSSSRLSAAASYPAFQPL